MVSESQKRAIKKWKEAHPDKAKEYVINFYQKNPDKKREYNIRAREKLKEKKNTQEKMKELEIFCNILEKIHLKKSE